MLYEIIDRIGFDVGENFLKFKKIFESICFQKSTSFIDLEVVFSCLGWVWIILYFFEFYGCILCVCVLLGVIF